MCKTLEGCSGNFNFFSAFKTTKNSSGSIYSTALLQQSLYLWMSEDVIAICGAFINTSRFVPPAQSINPSEDTEHLAGCTMFTFHTLPCRQQQSRGKQRNHAAKGHSWLTGDKEARRNNGYKCIQMKTGLAVILKSRRGKRTFVQTLGQDKESPVPEQI